jgi:hypothetical protein
MTLVLAYSWGCSDAPAEDPPVDEQEIVQTTAPLSMLSTPLSNGAPAPYAQLAAYFGATVDLDDDIAVVGAPSENISPGFTDAGAVYTFRKLSDAWLFEQRFAKPFLNAGYGSSVAVRKISSTDRLMVVARFNASATVRGLDFYRRTGSISSGSWTNEFQPTFAAGEIPGVGGIDAAGTTVVARTATALKIFERSGGSWTTTSVNVTAPASSGNADVSSNRIVIGCGSPPGEVRVYSKPWGSANFVTLLSTSPTVGTAGLRVAISGDRIVVGDRGAEKAYVYELTGGSWVRQTPDLVPPYVSINAFFGQSVDIDGSRIVIGAPQDSTYGGFNGSAFSFTRRGTGWRFDRQLLGSAPEVDHSYYGSDVAVRGKLAIVGQSEVASSSATAFGTAYAYQLDQLRVPDFNDDGRADAVIGNPGYAHGAFAIAGVASVLAGTTSGRTPATTLTEPTPEGGAIFGARMAWGRFNDGNFDDLVAGAPWKDSGPSAAETGAFSVLLGQTGSLGIDQATGVSYTRATPNVEGDVGAADYHSVGLAVGDFNADGFDDIASGAAGDTHIVGGSVQIFYGGPSGISLATDFILTEPNTPVAGDLFGWSLAAGDFNCDGIDDLAVGAIGREVGGVTDAGRVSIFRGSSTGLATTPVQSFDQSAVTGESVEAGDQFGEVLLAANLDGDANPFACVDLVIGVPHQDVTGNADAGSVDVMRGGTGILSGWKRITQDASDVGDLTDAAEAADTFGSALGLIRANNDGFDDLAIGVPGENTSEGAVHVLLGSATGPTGTGAVFWRESNIPGGTVQAGAMFGFALGAAAPSVLSIGVPQRDSAAGLVRVVTLANTGTITISSAQAFQQSGFPAPFNANQAGALFGYALTSARPGR